VTRRLLAWLYVVPGLGFAISTLAVLAYLDRRGELPMTPFGFRLLGSTVPGMGEVRLTPVGRALAWVLVGASVADAAIGVLLSSRRSGARRLAIVMAPITFGLAVLFQLPALLVVAPLRVLLVAIAGGGRSREA